LEKTKNNNHQFNEDDTYKTNNLTNNTESSVVPVSGRTDMAESPSGAKFKQLCETSNSELRTSHKGKQTPASPKLEKTRSWLETPREPRLDDFTIGQCKGEGRFGKVYMATHKKTGFLCALKKVKK
jgi:aurora kinase